MPYRFFPESSFALDKLFAKKILSQQGFEMTKLSHPILFRGDERSPDNVFRDGMIRRGVEIGFSKPEVEKNRTTTRCIATSTEFRYAIGFADSPALDEEEVVQSRLKNFIQNGRMKPETSWVYLLYAADGIELYKEEAGPSPTGLNKAQLVQEVALTGIPKIHILAAVEIKTTDNELHHYYLDADKIKNPDAVQWQVLLTDFRENQNCVLKTENPDLYASAIAKLKAHYDRGYFRIPTSPYPEDPFFGLNDGEAKAFKALDLSRAQVKALNFRQLRAINQGVSLEDVLRATNRYELEALAFVSYDEARGIKSTYQMSGLKYGFTREDVMSTWFSIFHVNIVFGGFPPELVRGREADVVKLVYNLHKHEKMVCDEHVLAILESMRPALGFDEYLSKPQLTKIKETILEALEKSESYVSRCSFC